MTRDAAMQLTDKILPGFIEQAGDNVSNVERQWDGNVLRFAFRTRGMKIKGTFLVTDDEVIVESKLPFVARPFEGRVRSAIEEQLDIYLPNEPAQHNDSIRDIPDEGTSLAGDEESSTTKEEKPNSDDSSDSRSRRIFNRVRSATGAARDAAENVAQESAERATGYARRGGQQIQDGLETIQRRVGEDYALILVENPVVKDTMNRADLLDGNDTLLRTAYNIPWATTLMWSAVAGSAVTLQGPIASVAGELLHYGPGHIARWKEVNQFMDSVAGRGHRLKFGHSVDYLPQIIEKFGIEGVPAYFMHLLQDFTTIDGIPIIPNAWEVKSWLQTRGLSANIAAGLVSISFAKVLAVLLLVHTARRITTNIRITLSQRRHLTIAESADRNGDYSGAVENYKRALDLQRNPEILMALGQVYMRRETDRLSAHQTFQEVMDLLAPHPTSTSSLGRAQISSRGIAGMNALATADVLAGIHPEHWNEHIQNLVKGTVFSFRETAESQSNQTFGQVREAVATPPYFSAAINYYLAAKSASYYPLDEIRKESVDMSLHAALRNLGMVALSDEENLRPSISKIRRLWTTELLQADEVKSALDRY